MAEVLFEIPEWLDYADYDNYPSESKPTTNADFINYSRNQNKLVGALTSAFLWQPNTNFIAGKIIITPNMPEGMEAVALTGGFTGTVEPAWESDVAEYQDSGVKWQLRYQHWSKDVEQITELTTGATNRLPNTSYEIGNVVYDRSNLSVALKCTRTGTTSNTELDISGNNVGDSVDDGSVVWKIVSRDFVNIIDEQRPIKTFTSLEQLGLDNNASEVDILFAMPVNSIFYYALNNDGGTAYPNLSAKMNGFLTIEKPNAGNYSRFIFNQVEPFKVWYSSYRSWQTPNFRGWTELAIKGALSMPSRNSINISLPTNGSSYTAPADGWVYTAFIGTPGGWFHGGLFNEAIGLWNFIKGPGIEEFDIYMPVKKGDTIKISLHGETKAGTQRFIYSQSEV